MRDPSPRVSIVIAAFQAETLVAGALKQVGELTFTDYELILVDDGSTDGTAAAFRAAAATNSRIRLVELSENGGLGAARAAGFSAARGTFIWNIDIDDEWPGDALDTLVAASSGADVVVGSAWRQDAQRRVLLPAPRLPSGSTGADALRLLLTGELTGHLWNKLIRRELFDESVYSDARVHSDLTMVAAVFARAASVVSVDPVVYTYVSRDGSNIRSRRPRGPGLAAASNAVRQAVAQAAPHLTALREYRRFFARSIVLSALRDSARADYSETERRERFDAARRQITAPAIAELVRCGDTKSAALLVLACLSRRGFMRVMSA